MLHCTIACLVGVPAINLALALRELATNPVKHGALSADAGLLRLPATAVGFDSQLRNQIMKHHFASSVDYAWELDGMIVTLQIPAARLEI